LQKVLQSPLLQFPGLAIYKSNLLQARVITYDQHIGSFSPEPFGWLVPPKFTRVQEPTLSWNQLLSLTRERPTLSGNDGNLEQIHGIA